MSTNAIHAVNRHTKLRFRYLIQRELGQGAGAVVYLADKIPEGGEGFLEQNAERVAIKVAFSLKQKNYLLREAELLQLLSKRAFERPRVVAVHQDGQVLDECDEEGNIVGNGRAVLELEYLPGKTLARWLTEDWFPKEEVPLGELVATMCEYVKDVALALDQVNSSDIIHRDLKPENLMVTADGLRLFDFNAARLDDDENVKTQGIGTEGYIAPEVLLGDGSYDFKADLFSLGIIAWELLHQAQWGRSLSSLTSLLEANATIDWPTPRFIHAPDNVQYWLALLMKGLLCHPDQRLTGAARAIELLDQLLEILRPPPVPKDLAAEDAVKSLDMIQTIMELRPSGQASVVADVDQNQLDAVQRFIRSRTRVADPLEEYLVDRVRATLDPKREGPSLLLLAGNAGDGKSYLIDRLVHHALDAKERERVTYVADATHALSPNESQLDRLDTFFAPFEAEAEGPGDRLYVIAMNTGMVIRYFEQSQRKVQLNELQNELHRQLGLKSGAETAYAHNVEVINLDLRSMLHPMAKQDLGFLEHMLDRLNLDDEESLVAPKLPGCEECRARTLCPVYFNLRALQRPHPRRALIRLLERAELDPEVHLSPRNLWGFLYRAITGGLERYDVPDRQPDDRPCEVVRKRFDAGDRRWLLAGHLYEQIFQHEQLGGVWATLARHNPTYASAFAIDQLHTRLTVVKNLDGRVETIDDLGGQGGVLCGTQLDDLLARLGQDFPAAQRRDIAVRRHTFFDSTLFKAFDRDDRHGGPMRFAELLQAYLVYSLEGPQALSKDQQTGLLNLCTLVRQVIVASYGRVIGNDTTLLRVSQPNPRSNSKLFIKAEPAALEEIFDPLQLIRPDVHALAHQSRPDLLSIYGYRPDTLTLNISGYRLVVDQRLHAFLRQVDLGKQPSALDLAEFQALRYSGERLGNVLASRGGQQQQVYILDGSSHRLFRLHRNTFGGVAVESVNVGGSL